LFYNLISMAVALTTVSMDEKEEIMEEVAAKGGEAELSQLVSNLLTLGVNPSQLKRYIKAAIRLRQLERQYGKNYNILLREYEKKFRESVKLEYSINELLEKRKRIEDDLRVYMEQQKLTLETVNRVNTLLKTLAKYNVDINHFEMLVKAAAKLSAQEQDVEKIFEYYAGLDEAEKRLQEIRRLVAEEEARLQQIRSNISGEEEKLKEIVEIGPEVRDLVGLRKQLSEEVSRLQAQCDELSMKADELAKEYEQLLGFKGNAEEVLKAIEEKKSELQKLEEEISKKKEMVEVLEEELISARALLMLLRNPEFVRREDLEALSRQLANVASVKAGEIPILKPLENSLVENARKRVVELVMPVIRNELIPKWVFEKLEKEFKEVVTKKAQLEEELSRLRAELGQQRTFTQTQQEQPSQTPLFFKLRKKDAFLQDDSGIRIRIRCPFCQASNLLILPSKSELENAVADKDLLMTTCFSCMKDISIDPSYLMEKFYRR